MITYGFKGFELYNNSMVAGGKIHVFTSYRMTHTLIQNSPEIASSDSYDRIQIRQLSVILEFTKNNVAIYMLECIIAILLFLYDTPVSRSLFFVVI